MFGLRSARASGREPWTRVRSRSGACSVVVVRVQRTGTRVTLRRSVVDVRRGRGVRLSVSRVENWPSVSAHDSADGSPLSVVRSMFRERNSIVATSCPKSCRLGLRPQLSVIPAWCCGHAQSGLTAPYAARQGDVWRPTLSVPDVRAPWSHLSITSSIRGRPSFTGANTVARCGKSLETPPDPRR
jgi:hypothetical protein